MYQVKVHLYLVQLYFMYILGASQLFNYVVPTDIYIYCYIKLSPCLFCLYSDMFGRCLLKVLLDSIFLQSIQDSICVLTFFLWN